MSEYPPVTLRSDMVVEMVDNMGGDRSVIRAMLVSTSKDDTAATISDESVFGKINFLMRNRHGTPYEHTAMTFYSEAPIFVYREWHRHRIGVSINEQSGRYSELPPMFYVPGPGRNLVQVGKPGAYEFVPGPVEKLWWTCDALEEVYRHAYANYRLMLDEGVAKEVARMCLPVATYSKMYWTCNCRSLMAFLSLRTKREGSTFPSFPQREIEMAAELLEEAFATAFPLTHRAFEENGRVSP